MEKVNRVLSVFYLIGLSFMVIIGLIGRYGIPYMFEKYGMPGDAVVTKLTTDHRGVTVAHYEFHVDGKLYWGSVDSHRVQEGDTILIWYFLSFPWINECHEESVIK